MPAGTLILRADAGVAMGAGHFMRCLALAQAWRDEGGSCIFAMAETTRAAEECARADMFDVCLLSAAPATRQDSTQLVELASSRYADWVAVDGYQFDVAYQRAVKAAGLKLLLVDDTGHAGTYVADLVLDQNASARENFYRQREAYTGILLGPRYAMLRREFKPWREWKRDIAPIGRKVLITMGGSDPQNLTLRVIQALRSVKIEGIEVAVVAGGANPHLESLEQAIAGDRAVRLHKNAANMAELMAGADVAVSAAGTTCWEMCLLGLPALLADLAENQRPVARELDQVGVAIHLGSGVDILPEEIVSKLEGLLLSPDVRSVMSQRGRSLVDGRGAERVVSALLGTTLQLRPVEQGDCRLLWEWANDQDVRLAAFSSAPIAWEEHVDWFTRKLGDERIQMLLASDEHGSPVGQIRFEKSGDREADVDVSIARARRGRGLAGRLIEEAVQSIFQNAGVDRVHAFVKPGNLASAKAFERAGFRNVGNEWVKGNAAVHYQRNRGGREGERDR